MRLAKNPSHISSLDPTSIMLARAGARVGGRVRLLKPAGTAQYHENIVDHYENPRNVGTCQYFACSAFQNSYRYEPTGSLDKKDTDVGTGLVGAPACGDVMKLQVRTAQDDYVKKY
jgi:hypothetical protein